MIILVVVVSTVVVPPILAVVFPWATGSRTRGPIVVLKPDEELVA